MAKSHWEVGCHYRNPSQDPMFYIISLISCSACVIILGRGFSDEAAEGITWLNLKQTQQMRELKAWMAAECTRAQRRFSRGGVACVSQVHVADFVLIESVMDGIRV